jgi:NAD(P)-dependent dehydrogenase (short-subunit alcohol dehydrogenase family)
MKNYLIVGASSGIGFELAKQLSVANTITALSRTQNELSSLSNINFYAVDITVSQPLFPVIENPIDAIIYCPGSINLKPFRALKEEDFLSDININLFGAIKTIKQYLPNLQQAENSSIILFSTVAVQMGMPFHASIASAKGAVEGLTKSLAAEFAPKIRVNCIAPSLTQTPLAEKLINAETKLKAAEERHPLKRIGETKDIVEAIQFLLHANWVTGQIIHVDGGMSSIR